MRNYQNDLEIVELQTRGANAINLAATEDEEQPAEEENQYEKQIIN